VNLIAKWQGWLLSLLQACFEAEFNYPIELERIESKPKPQPQRYWKRRRAA
jgi:hypothetical protein